MKDTNQQYDKAIEQCRDIFIKKTRDYGTAWRVLRTISVVDQIFIKSLRIFSNCPLSIRYTLNIQDT